MKKIILAVYAVCVLGLIVLMGLMYSKSQAELAKTENTLQREIWINDQVLKSIQKQYRQYPPKSVEQGILL